MIGGIDIHISTCAGDSSLIAAVRAIRRYWPNSVFENGTTGERYQSYWSIPFQGLAEVFAYRDSHAADVWDEEGAIPTAYNSMIHLLSEDGLTTVVVDDLNDPVIAEMVQAISSALHSDIFSTAAELEAA